MDIVYGFKGASQDMVAKKSTQLFLLAKFGNLEVIKQKIAQDKLFAFKGSDNQALFEFVYILEGSIRHTKDKRVLQEGDYLIVSGSIGETYFETLTPVTVLYLTNSPVFYDQKNRIEQMMQLAKEVEERDLNTEEHCLRLQEMVTRVGQELGLTDEELFHLVYAAVLHDLGKKDIPVEVLTKPGALTDEEWILMKKHPIWGKDTISKFLGDGEFSKIGEIVSQHHERYDGTGYPYGLKGEQILLAAQILSIADAYDAMISRRSYKDALSAEEAVRRLECERGRQFSSRVVDAFLKLEKSFRKEGISKSV